MTKTDFLKCLRDETRIAIKDLRLPVRRQKEDESEPEPRSADVHLMRLPDSKLATKKAPYIIHQLLTGKDQQAEGNRILASAVVRSIFCVYHDDEEEGGLALLGLMERLRIYLLRRVEIGNRYKLDLQQGVEFLIYPDDTAPYYNGEMMSSWFLPRVEREVNFNGVNFKTQR